MATNPKAYMMEYQRERRRSPEERLRAEASKLSAIPDSLESLVDPLSDIGEFNCAEILVLALADLRIAITSVNSAVGCLPSVR